MLVSFSVSNFRSIGEEVTLNMVASNKLSDHEGHRVEIGDTGKHLLRSALLYGANAAGKSNLIKAISAAQEYIRDRRRPIIATPFRFEPEYATKPSSFEFRILISGRVFVYGFDVLQNRIISEWLAVKKGDEEIDIFTRNENGNATLNDSVWKRIPGDERSFAVLKVLAELQIRDDQLFLNRVSEIPDEVQGRTLRSIIDWFSNDLVVLHTNSRDRDLMNRLQEDPQFKTFCDDFLSRVGTGVGSLGIRETERDAEEIEARLLSRNRQLVRQGHHDIRLKPDNPARIIERQLVAMHGSVSLPFADESDGTQSLLQLMPSLASTPDKTSVVVIDELDRSLHPLLCWEFIRFFSESCPGTAKQLIVTTHEAHLLNQELLRRDEYWFVEKDQRQQTQLVSLSDFSIRKDLQIQKGYLQGRFGAIPIIGGMRELEKLLECASTEDEDATEATPA